MSTIYPSQSNWITPRTNETQLTDQNCRLLLPQRIDKIDKMVINTKSFFVDKLRYNTGTGQTNYSGVAYNLYTSPGVHFSELDITKYIIERAKYNTLQFTKINDLNLYNTWYYEHNGREIVLVSTRPNIFTQFVPEQLVADALINYLNNNKLYDFRDGAYHEITDYIDVQVYSLPLMSAQFRVYYTPLGESVKLQTPKTIPVERQFAIPFSQQQPMVDNVSHGRGMQSTSNRIGCETKQIIRVFHSIKEYRRPGVAFYEKDANGKRTGAIWRLTECNLKIYSDKMYRVVETWSKNWTLRSENVPLNREFRSWNIPADIVQRDLYYQDYCVLSKRPLALDQTGMFFSDEAKQELFRGLTPTKNSKRTECTNMIFFRPHPTLENSKIGAVINASAFGFGNSLVFTGKTQDNLSAGVQRVAKDDSDKNYQFCKDVYYCNDDGTLPHMHIELCAALQTSDMLENDASYRYPESVLLATGSNVYYLNIADDTNGVRLLKQYEFDIRKDPSEQLNFTYQLHLMTTEPELIIGTTWASENGLVKERETAPTIKTWTLNKTLPGGAQAMTAYYGDLAASNDVCTVNIANGTIKFSPPANTVGVVLTDEYNNILVAYNGTTEATYTAYYTHDYSALAKAIGAAS